MNHPVDITRLQFLSALVRKRYPFRPLWPSLCWRMLSWGLSAATVLRVFEKRYTRFAD